ncbi:unnamed protein product, partial [Porites lobata]
IAFGNFKLNQGYKLSATKISSYLVTAVSHCILSCVSDSRCNSINFAVNPDSNNLHACELLDTDKCRAASGDFQVNVDFLHYSPQVIFTQFLFNFNFLLQASCQRKFLGIQCERKGKSCSEIKLCSPQATSGSYVIDPDGEGGYEPFTVHCDMTDKNGVGVTVVGHDSETRTLVNGHGPPGSYVRNVHYIGTGLTNGPQLAGLLDMSANCEQFIKYECHGSALHSNGNRMAGGYHVT